MMAEQFEIKKFAESSLEEKGSKFLAFVFHTNSQSEAASQLKKMKEEHPKANHHCYAYRIRDGRQMVENLSDDGEPTHSAGQPILRQLQSRQLSNVQLIVVRYFGGTKLGMGGLIKAYKNAAAEVLNLAGSRRIIQRESLKLEMDYQQWGKVVSLLERNQIQYKVQHKNRGVSLALEVEEEEKRILVGLLAPL